MVYQIVDLFLKDYEIENSISSKNTYTNQKLKSFAGTYEMFPGSLFNIIVEDNLIYYQTFGSEEKMNLPLMKDGNFAHPNLPISYFSFDEEICKFHIADFIYPSKKVKRSPAKLNKKDLLPFEGFIKIKNSIPYTN